MSKQTAVEKLINAIKGQIKLSQEHLEMLESYGNQSKKLEREQIEDAYLNGTIQFANEAEIINPKTSKEYYEETYGGK
jgi:hypothetical protein